MTRFRSILFTHATVGAAPAAPDCLPDLHLDDIIETLSAGDAEGTLRPLYYAWARDVDEVTYRHEVFRDLSNPRTRSPVQAFVSDITEMRRQLTRPPNSGIRCNARAGCCTRWIVTAAR